MRAWLKASVKACTAVLIVATLTSILLGATAYTPGVSIRPLAEFYLNYSLNPYSQAFWAASPEVVTAMLWDYRGLDTVFESTVFFLAIVGSASVFRFASAALSSFEAERRGRGEEGLSVIVRVVTRIVFVLIVALSTSIALHGTITPGGGFQSGSIFSIAPLLAIAAFSRRFVEKLGITRDFCIATNAAGLIAISIIALAPLASALSGLANAYIIQNQPKPWPWPFSAPFGYPVQLGLLMAGSLTLFNLAEYFAVSFGFTLTFVILSIPEDFFRRLLRR